MQRRERDLLTEEMYLRVGELAAHFGRYDMYAKALLDLLCKDGVQSANDPGPGTIESRGTAISRLMLDHLLPRGIQDAFRRIDEDMRTLLSRHVIAAQNPAVISAANRVEPPKLRGTGHPRDWFDPGRIDPKATQTFIRSLERDVLQVIALYLELAELIHKIRTGVRLTQRAIPAVLPIAPTPLEGIG